MRSVYWAISFFPIIASDSWVSANSCLGLGKCVAEVGILLPFYWGEDVNEFLHDTGG